MAAVARAELVQSPEPGIVSRSLIQVQGPQSLRHPLLLSQAIIGRELDGKWSSMMVNQHPYEMPAVLEREGLAS